MWFMVKQKNVFQSSYNCYKSNKNAAISVLYFRSISCQIIHTIQQLSAYIKQHDTPTLSLL